MLRQPPEAEPDDADGGATAVLVHAGLLLSVASIAFSFARPLDRLSPTLPLQSIFHPALLLSVWRLSARCCTGATRPIDCHPPCSGRSPHLPSGPSRKITSRRSTTVGTRRCVPSSRP